MAFEISGSDVVEFTVYIVALAQIFTAVFQASRNGERAATQFDNGSAGFEGPLDEVGAIVLDLLSSQGIIELLVGMYVKILVGERVKEDPFKSRKSSV